MNTVPGLNMIRVDFAGGRSLKAGWGAASIGRALAHQQDRDSYEPSSVQWEDKPCAGRAL